MKEGNLRLEEVRESQGGRIAAVWIAGPIQLLARALEDYIGASLYLLEMNYWFTWVGSS